LNGFFVMKLKHHRNFEGVGTFLWKSEALQASGTDVMIFKIFSPKNSAKKLPFLTQNKAKLCKILIITLVFEKNANFFAENWQKSQKIVIITSTPGRRQTLVHTYTHTNLVECMITTFVCTCANLFSFFVNSSMEEKKKTFWTRFGKKFGSVAWKRYFGFFTDVGCFVKIPLLCVPTYNWYTYGRNQLNLKTLQDYIFLVLVLYIYLYSRAWYNIPKREKSTKWPQHLPNDHIIYQMTITSNNWPQNIPNWYSKWPYKYQTDVKYSKWL
jgi:hypothetical protein